MLYAVDKNKYIFPMSSIISVGRGVTHNLRKKQVKSRKSKIKQKKIDRKMGEVENVGKVGNSDKDHLFFHNFFQKRKYVNKENIEG